ncbi:MAG: hypothetical protein J6V50_00490 [Clostridia bacterium]|nr:hypothetical protein [Clostridia bacterium]
MKKVISILLCLFVTICLVSCTLSQGGDSSTPANADTESNTSVSSEYESGESGTQSSVSSEKTSSAAGSDSQSSSNLNSSDAAISGSMQSSSNPNSSVIVPTFSGESSTGSTQQPTSSETTSSNSASKPETTPISPQNYYCYNRLNETQRQAYNSVLVAADAMPSGFIELGDASKVSQSDAYLIAIALKNDHPEIFWLPYAWYIGETHNGKMAILFANETSEDVSGGIESFTATYVVERAKKQSMQNELSMAVERIKSKITATEPYEIELQLHDILCEEVKYDHSFEPSTLSYTAYGALVKGTAVCEGYSRAFQMLLYEFGINSTLVTGYAGQEHMWNVVEIGGRWHHVDVTWNDQESELRHTYFNLSDSSIGRDHIINDDFATLSEDEVLHGIPFNYSLPICNSVAENFFEKTGFTLPRDMDELVSKIASGNLKTAEIIGFSQQVEESLETKLIQKGFTAGLRFIYDGDWAKIIVAK